MVFNQLFLVLASVAALEANALAPRTNGSSDPWSSVFKAPAVTANTDLNQTLSTPGAPGIYNSSQTPNGQYGSYNWCNMPHVRSTEYVKPQKGYKLQYVEVIQRHHKRTPYASNTFFKEDIPWNCTGEGPYAYGKSATGFMPSSVYWQAQTGTQNPFEKTIGPGFVNSTCVFPAITSQGLDDAHQHGVDLKGVYGDMLGFLPSSAQTDQYSFRVTNNVITSQTMGALIKGLYPDLQTHSAWIQSSTFDSLEPALSCPAKSAIKSANEGSNPAWLEHLNQSAGLRARFNNVSGIQYNDTAGWNTSWDHPYDNLSAKQCHQKTLPCSVNNTAVCLSQSDANQIYRLGQYEYAYRWRSSPQALHYSSLTMGPWFKELMGHLDAVKSGASKMKYYHNFAHDGSLAPVLGMLQIDQPFWPGMGTEVVFEMYSKSNQYYMRVLVSGQVLQSSALGKMDMIPLSQFESYINSIVPSDIVAACKASS